MKTSIAEALKRLPGPATAGDVHRFENFGKDFVTWVVFYGPTGGEK